MREIVGPVLRHLWAWHKLTAPLFIVVFVLLLREHWLLGVGVLLWGFGWFFTDLNGHAVIHHPAEWTSARWVRCSAQVVAVAGVCLLVLWSVTEKNRTP